VIRRDLRPLAVAALAAALVSGRGHPAAAQMAPGGFGAPGGMQPPPPGGGGQEKEEGPAEEAPEENRPADLEPLGEYAEQARRRMQIFELDGYLRLRSDYLHNFALGQAYTNVPDGVPGVHYGLPPFPLPVECPAPIDNSAPPSPLTTSGGPASRCPHDSIGGANLRFRLEPTINVTDQVRIHAQIDVIDNTILGSTPDSLAGIPGYNVPPATNGMTGTPVSSTALPGVAPSDFLYTTQDAPEVGQNGFVSSIRAKRAWAEVDSEFGSLRFGRMPWQWGRGMFYNAGGCPDCDVGTTVDRVMALTTLYGHQFAAAWDLGAQGPTTQQLTLGRTDPNGYQYDLSQNDDVLELMASVTRIDDPVALRERIDRGDMVVNYGVQVVYRNQTLVPQNSAPTTATAGMPNGAQPQSPDQLAQETYFGALSLTPDLWLKLYYKSLTVEFEGIGIFGRIDKPGALAADGGERLTLRQLGWVAAGELKLYRDSFFIGLETGGATGDQAEQPGQYLNYRWHFVQQPAGDHNLNDFHFSPDYHIDEILFRHIIGTVTNAIYIKPQASYWFDLGRTRSIGVSGAAIYSMAQVPVSTPGNSINYGIETDVSAGYRNTSEGFYAGLTWGILWPLGALDRPKDLWGDYSSDATVAQVLRVTFGVKF
jgi:uncharacterized protein (TIGR04551 family)